MASEKKQDSHVALNHSPELKLHIYTYLLETGHAAGVSPQVGPFLATGAIIWKFKWGPPGDAS